MALPPEVVADILSRLPVECLLRFRCVCPPWRDLIDSPRFVKLHLNRSIQTETNLNLVFYHPGLQIAKLQPSDCSLQATELDHNPFGADETGLQVWGSCNGLICLVNTSSNAVVLWNPSTRKHVKLPEPKFETLEDESLKRFGCGYGFGYDSAGDDYKVVMVVEIVRKSDESDEFVVAYEVRVYSNKSDSWHVVEDFPYLPSMHQVSAKFAAGKLHYTMGFDPKKIDTIVAFDLGTEKCRIVPGPKLDSWFQCRTTVDSFQETISLAANYFLGYIDVWVMKEYGVEESWTKLFTLANQCSRPFYCPKNSGEVLLQHNHSLIWFGTKHCKPSHELVKDLKHKCIKNVQVCGRKEVTQVEICIGSLVPLRGSRKVIHEKKKKKKKRAKERNDMSGFLSKGFKLVL